MTKSFLSGNLSNEKGYGNLVRSEYNTTSSCIEQTGIIDIDKTLQPITGKPIGKGKGHKNGNVKVLVELRMGMGKYYHLLIFSFQVMVRYQNQK
jgi:hypothetical protein